MSLSLAPQFWWVTTAEAIHIHFQAEYFTGPAPDGHEVLVWQKNGASHSAKPTLSHYFPVSTLNATVEGLLPSTEYFLYVRANGTHFANNQGSWVVTEIKTQPPGMPLCMGIIVSIYSYRDIFLKCALNYHASTYTHAHTFTHTHTECCIWTCTRTWTTIKEATTLIWHVSASACCMHIQLNTCASYHCV